MAKQASKAKSGSEPKHHATEANERNAQRREAKGGEAPKMAVAGQLIPEASVQPVVPGEGGLAEPRVVDQAATRLATAESDTGSTTQPGDVPTRAKGSGFRKEARTMANGVVDDTEIKDMALAEEHAPDTIFLPNQTLLPSGDQPGVVVNIPYGSEPRNLNPETGAVTYVAREPNEEADEVSGREVADKEEA